MQKNEYERLSGRFSPVNHNRCSYLNSILVEQKRLQNGKIWNDCVQHPSVCVERYETKLSSFNSSWLLCSQNYQGKVFPHAQRFWVEPAEIGDFSCNWETFFHEFCAKVGEQKEIDFHDEAQRSDFHQHELVIENLSGENCQQIINFWNFILTMVKLNDRKQITAETDKR